MVDWWMNGRIHAWTNDGLMNEYMEGFMCEIDEWMEGYMCERMMDWWMNGRMHVWTNNGLVNEFKYTCVNEWWIDEWMDNMHARTNDGLMKWIWTHVRTNDRLIKRMGRTENWFLQLGILGLDSAFGICWSRWFGSRLFHGRSTRQMFVCVSSWLPLKMEWSMLSPSVSTNILWNVEL